MAARFEENLSLQTRCNYKLNSKVTTLIRTSGGTLHRGERSDFGVFHTRLSLLLVPKGPILVRTQKLLVITVSVSFSKSRLALLDPLRHPPQGAEVHLHNDGGDVGGLLQEGA